MCVTCGCGDTATPPFNYAPRKKATAKAARTVSLEASVLDANARFAEQNRASFATDGVTAYNLLSSPGSGKTTLLCATLQRLRQMRPELSLAVIEGDQQTELDADRIRATDVPVVQINTGHGCHLDAKMVGEAWTTLPKSDLLFIENVGNLVCPALWDIGEAAKIVVLSVTEGEDKPLKYPDMFAAARLMVLNKIDLLPYVSFDVERCITHARRINPDIEVLEVSATRGDGLDAWLNWLLRPIAPVRTAEDSLAA